MKLNEEQIKTIYKLNHINKRKDYVQDDVLIPAWKAHPMGLIRAFTGIGKGTMVAKLIQSLNTNYPDFTFAVIVPTEHLYKDLLKDIEDFQLKNVSPFIINTYSKRIKEDDWKPKFDVLIMDEAHIGSSDTSLVFSTAVPKTDFKYFLGVSATFENEHIAHFEKLGIPLLFDIPIEDGYRCNMVPSYTIYNLPIELTEAEKVKYSNIQDYYDELIQKFTLWEPYNPVGAILSCLTPKNKFVRFHGKVGSGRFHAEEASKVLGIDNGQVIGLAIKWRNAQKDRAVIIDNNNNSILMTAEILKRVKDKEAIVFCSNTQAISDVCEITDTTVPYHYKLGAKGKTESLYLFESGIKPHIVTCKSLDMGYDRKNLALGIQQGYTSKSGRASQRSGRTNRFDPENLDKESMMVNLFIDDFTLSNGKKVLSQQKKRLINSQKGKVFVQWVKSIDEIPFDSLT